MSINKDSSSLSLHHHKSAAAANMHLSGEKPLSIDTVSSMSDNFKKITLKKRSSVEELM